MELEAVKYVVWAEDKNRCRDFYLSLFDGGKVIKDNSFITEISLAGTTLSIHGGGEGKPTWTGLSFQVACVIQGAEAVKKLGGELRAEPEPEDDAPPHLAMCQDLDGNQFMLTRKR